MESDDLAPIIPRKRSRSRSPSQAPMPVAALGPNSNNNSEPRFVRQPKRQRKSKIIPTYDAAPDEHILQRMDRSNPLSRKIFKREAKKARKAGVQRRKGNVSALNGKAEMDVDDQEGLQFTFMV